MTEEFTFTAYYENRTRPIREVFEKYKDINQQTLGKFELRVMLMDVWDTIKDYCEEEVESNRTQDGVQNNNTIQKMVDGATDHNDF